MMMKNKKVKILWSALGALAAVSAIFGYLIKKNDILLECKRQNDTDTSDYDEWE